MTVDLDFLSTPITETEIMNEVPIDSVESDGCYYVDQINYSTNISNEHLYLALRVLIFAPIGLAVTWEQDITGLFLGSIIGATIGEIIYKITE